MSASLSSLIDLSVDQPTIVGSAGSLAVDDVPADLLTTMSAVTDPRCRRGVRHQLVVVLGVAVCAVLGGARSYVAIAEWATDLPEVVRERLGIRRVPPSESAIRRVLQAVDPVLLNRAVVGWLNSHAAPRHAVTGRGRRGWTVIAVDGKTMRGARLPGGRQTHLLAAVDTTAGTVAAQTVVDGKTNEISMFAPLLDQLHDLTGVIVTADALHTQRGHAEYLHGRGAHYVFTVKAKQPTLLAQLGSLPWASVPTST